MTASDDSNPPVPAIPVETTPVQTISPQLEYERGPSIGKLAIDDVANGVAVRVAAPARRPLRIVKAAAFWGVLAMMGYVAARSASVRSPNLAGWAGAYLLWLGFIAGVAWFIWPRRWPIVFMLATPQGLEMTPRGKPMVRLERDQIDRVTTFMSSVSQFWNAPVTVAAVLVSGETVILGRGSLEECEAMAESVRRGLGMESVS